MGHYKGHLAEILLEAYQNATARLYCPVEAIPRPGQYLQIWAPHDELSVVPVLAFAAGEAEVHGKEAVLPIDARLPENWHPGIELQLRGPLGRGFDLPKRAKRVLLAALAGGPGRLLPLARQALGQSAQVVLCANQPTDDTLPIEIEVREVSVLSELLGWADYLAVDARIEGIEGIGKTLGIDGRLPRALTAEVLVLSSMPCGGLAQCGVCAVETSSKPILLCESGPVLDLNRLLQS